MHWSGNKPRKAVMDVPGRTAACGEKLGLAEETFAVPSWKNNCSD